ncbi:hypothetical protein K6V18_04155 [Ralstonia insidiosa]|uniref:hypothetical protein n=1 Tax=Ralstonia TaxID=48736 RepID=UPI00066A425B|nr:MULTISPECIES: hypothetical protein [Ralstonia]MBY4704196.1 hypothetical protein [Ralstonia insidiosa]GAQ30854.1 hypothetical protein SAMD00023378_4537 [Ralstonia sp. NT80]
MAHADSSSQAWERLNDAIYALQAFGQIISTTSSQGYEWMEHVSCVFCHLADNVRLARDGFEDAQAEKVSAAAPALEVANG